MSLAAVAEEPSLESRIADTEAEVAGLRARLQFASMVEKERLADDKLARKSGRALATSVADVMALSLIALGVGAMAYFGAVHAMGRIQQLEAAVVELQGVAREMLAH